MSGENRWPRRKQLEVIGLNFSKLCPRVGAECELPPLGAFSGVGAEYMAAASGLLRICHNTTRNRACRFRVKKTSSGRGEEACAKGNLLKYGFSFLLLPLLGQGIAEKKGKQWNDLCPAVSIYMAAHRAEKKVNFQRSGTGKLSYPYIINQSQY